MEENKNVNPETEVTQTEVKQEKVKKKFKINFKKDNSKPKRIKNQALLKRGGYAVGITAAVLAGVIVLNVL